MPVKCDALSFCGAGAGYQLNFMNALIMLIMTVCVFTASFCLVRKQKQRDVASHLKDPSGDDDDHSDGAEVEDVADGGIAPVKYSRAMSVSPEDRVYVEATFTDLVFRVPMPALKTNDNGKVRHVPQYRDILPGICGTVPAGKFSVILGPTAWYQWFQWFTQSIHVT